MSSALRQFDPEWRQFTDARTGALITQWTAAPAMHHHLYFTNPSISTDGRTGLFISYRNGYPNLYRIDLRTGVMHQVSDCVDLNAFSAAACPVSPWIYYSAGDTVRAVCRDTAELRTLARFEGARLGNCAISGDGQHVAIGVRRPGQGELAIIDAQSGAADIATRRDEVGHCQFCPGDSNLLMYSGPAAQRIWVHDRRTGHDRLVYTQRPGEWVVHESWLGGAGRIVFPRWPYAVHTALHDGSALRRVTSLNAWHVCGSRDGRWIVADTNHPDRGLVLIDPATGRSQRLCDAGATQRGTQWRYDRAAAGAGIDTSILRSDTPANDPPPQPGDAASTYGPQWSHPHPAFSPDGRVVVFTSDRDGYSQVYHVATPVDA